jgi:hypothetical protein
VYSLRFRTEYKRGSALSEPYSGVNVLLVSHDGRALLHRVSSVNVPEEASRLMSAICEVTCLGFARPMHAPCTPMHAQAAPQPVARFSPPHPLHPSHPQAVCLS